MLRCLNLLSFLCLFATSTAYAASISAIPFDQSAYVSATNGFSLLAAEDFENATVGNVAPGYMTNVGSFYSIGGVGSGGTINQASFNNDGSLLAIREGDVFGRTSTTPILSNDLSDDQFLDSNDTFGIRWEASAGGSPFDRLVLTITDASEFKNMVIEVDSMTYSLGDLGNGVSMLLQIDFASSVTEKTVYFRHLNHNGHPALNDGFSLDDIAITAVPVPGAFILLMGALASLGLTQRRIH